MIKYTQHSFYCPKCGQKMMDLQRGTNKTKEKHHRKRLWCPWCKEETNSVECRNDNEVYEFKREFEAGFYIEDALEATIYIQNNPNLIWS